MDNMVSCLTDSLAGILKEDCELEKEKDLTLKEKYEIIETDTNLTKI